MNQRWQQYLDSVAATATEVVYIHPGAPHLDGNTLGQGSQRHILLKQILFSGTDGNVYLLDVRAHFIDGTSKWLVNISGTNAWMVGSGLDSEQHARTLDHDLQNVAAIAFTVRNAHVSDAKGAMCSILFETVK